MGATLDFLLDASQSAKKKEQVSPVGWSPSGKAESPSLQCALSLKKKHNSPPGLAECGGWRAAGWLVGWLEWRRTRVAAGWLPVGVDRAWLTAAAAAVNFT